MDNMDDAILTKQAHSQAPHQTNHHLQCTKLGGHWEYV